MWIQMVVSILFLIAVAYGVYIEMVRRDGIARGMAVDWLQNNHPGCIVKSITSNKMVWPVRVVMQVHTPKNENFEIKVRVGDFFGGIFGDRIEVVYIRKIKPKN
ncbi:hypothetical protein [Chromobacterium sp. ASV23]|uniref:hypothetical protein n=1 Tax=Chromobacterium sp. ASV23 TaxID=2795110 RepID=UPI0018EAACEC|nr:hypothetical protein [Chromobacterium sp. ASV23]